MAAAHTVDDYLETIYFLAFPIGEVPAGHEGGSTLAVRVGEMLSVSRASAGEMLKRLESEGLVERGDQGRRFSRRGRDVAERVVRRHRIIERLLTDFAAIPPAEAHEQGDLLGNTFTDDMVERVAKQLGQPDRCPHGWPVDVEFEQAENKELKALAELEPIPGRDRPAGRARRRPPALVLRPGARSGGEARAAPRGAGRRPGRDRDQRRRAGGPREGRRRHLFVRPGGLRPFRRRCAARVGVRSASPADRDFSSASTTRRFASPWKALG